MPTCNIYLFGNLPAELDLDQDGICMGCSVETKDGTVWLDLPDIELDAIVSQNCYAVLETMAEYNCNAVEYARLQARKE